MERAYRNFGILSGILFLIFLHLYRLAEIPGLHFDEAWAMNYAWEIASRAGFWPVSAMSPYTAPWAHYWAALWMKVLGPSVLVFRGSQVFLSLGGLLALCFALPKHIRAVFPWAVILVPGLVLNHRFAIELTGLHCLLFGLYCLCLSKRNWEWAAVCALIATTAHILFFAVALATLALVLLEAIPVDKKMRRAGTAYFGLVALFFLRVLLSIPEKGKAAALLFACVAAMSILLAGGNRWYVWKWTWWKPIAALASLVFIFNALFFGLGIWTAGIYTGFEVWDYWPFALLAALGAAAFFASAVRGALSAPLFTSRSFLLLTLFLGLMMLKPAPRYFELSLLGLAVFFAWQQWDKLYAITWPPTKTSLRQVTMAGLLAINTGMAFTLCKEVSLPRETPLHFLFFKDSSRDFLDKQSLVKFLGGSGCALSGIHTGDPRLAEELKALSLGDWPVETKLCPYNVVNRAAEGGTGEPFGEFMLRKKF